MTTPQTPALDGARRAELVKLAEAAKDFAIRTHAPRWYNAQELSGDTDDRVEAAFIAACTPDVILALCAALEAGAADTRRLDWLAASRSEIGHSTNGKSVYTRQPDGTVPSCHAPTLREAIDLASASSHHREQTDMQSYVAQVRRVWEDHWRPKTSHRYGQDFASFLGERVLTDFNARV